MRVAQDRWWDGRATLVALVALAFVPLLWPALPPLNDLPGHIGRYRIAMGQSPELARYFSYDWHLIGNLGVDLIVVPLARLVGLDLATKLVVMTIAPLTVAGMLCIAREVHGGVPPTTLFALPLAFGWPFQLGFVNFCLAMALAFLAFALWLRMARLGRIALRAALFVPIAWILWIAHSFGWGAFGLFAFGSELARMRAAGWGWRGTVFRAAVACIPLTMPVLAMVGHTSPVEGGTGDWFNMVAKGYWLASILRDHWKWFDVASAALLLILCYAGLRNPRLRMAPMAGAPALFAFGAFLILPRLLMGGAYVDMRMAPYAVALALIAIRPGDDEGALAQRLALAGAVFLILRLAGNTLSFALHDAEQTRELAALDAIPKGASVLSLVNMPCRTLWDSPRADHLPGMAIARRDAFTNEQWAIAGQQLVRVRAVNVGAYASDPSQLVYPVSCRVAGSDFDAAIAGFDRRGFGYVWTPGFAAGRAHAADLSLIWHSDSSALYQVVR